MPSRNEWSNTSPGDFPRSTKDVKEARAASAFLAKIRASAAGQDNQHNENREPEKAYYPPEGRDSSSGSGGYGSVPSNGSESGGKGGVNPVLIVIAFLMLIATVYVVMNQENGEKSKAVEVVSQIHVQNSLPQVNIQNNAPQEKSEIKVYSFRGGKPKVDTNVDTGESSVQQPAQQFAQNFAAQPSQQNASSNCPRLTDLSAGKGYLLGRSECFLMGFTPNLIYVGAESPFMSISGADFIVTTNDESSSCDSRQSNDRCTAWINQNQKLGGEDSRLHKPRFWMSFKTYGDIYIQTSQAIVNPCMHISDLSAGKGYALGRGECFLMGFTPNLIYVGAESKFVSVAGADFVVMTNDESTSCDSRQSNDRCSTWINQNQTLGGEDQHLHKPRFWLLFKTFGDIRIYTSSK